MFHILVEENLAVFCAGCFLIFCGVFVPALALTLREGFTLSTMERNIGEVARLFNITQRTLRHWDEISLACPSYRDWNDYRLYTDADVERIGQVIAYRAVGFPLSEIQTLLDAPGVDATAHLRRQRQVLLDRKAGLNAMLEALDTLLEDAMSPKLTREERAEIFGEMWDPAWEDEARERWGDSPEWEQSERVKAQMSKADWLALREETQALESSLGAAFDAGVEPGSEEANALAEEHFASINRWFDMTYAKHVILGRGYTQDPRMTAYYDKVRPGLAAWLSAIIDANAAQHGVDPQHAQWC